MADCFPLLATACIINIFVIGNFNEAQSFNMRCIAMHVSVSVKTLKSWRNIRITFSNKNRNFWTLCFVFGRQMNVEKGSAINKQ